MPFNLLCLLPNHSRGKKILRQERILMKKSHILRIRQERERRGWSRSYVAEQIEVDVITVGRWERGERMPHPQYRQKLCALFEMNAQDLGLFSEFPQESNDATAVVALSPEPDKEIPADGLSGGSETSGDRAIGADPPQEIPSRFSSHRRRFLIGLGGLGIAALTGGGLLLAARSLHAPVPMPVKVPLSKRSHHFLDANSSNWVNHLAWSPDGSEVAVASGSNVISIWNIEKEAIVFYYPTLNEWVNDVSWSKANWIAATTADHHEGSLQIWKFPEKEPVFILPRPYSLRSVSWSPNGQYLALSGRIPVVEVWDPFTSRLVSQYFDSTLGLMGITRVKWSPSGKFLACAADDNTAHVWEALTGTPRTIYRGHQNTVQDLDWSPDEQHIVSASADKTSRVWEASSGRTLYTYRGHAGVVEGVDWSPRGKYIATASSDFTAHVWEPFTGKLAAIYGGHSSIVETVLWTTDGTALAIGTDKEGVEIWQAPQ
jgi:WD40 repeat protein/transcriptional regulator with XRE-family HTH domain